MFPPWFAVANLMAGGGDPNQIPTLSISTRIHSQFLESAQTSIKKKRASTPFHHIPSSLFHNIPSYSIIFHPFPHNSPTSSPKRSNPLPVRATSCSLVRHLVEIVPGTLRVVRFGVVRLARLGVFSLATVRFMIGIHLGKLEYFTNLN